MSLGNSTPRRMDLAAFPLGDVEEHKRGIFRHRESLGARIERLWGRKPLADDERPKDPDMFAWHSVEALLEKPR